LPDTRDSSVRDRAVVSVPAAHPWPPRPGDRVTLTGAGFTDVNPAPASPGLRVRRAAPAGEAITKERLERAVVSSPTEVARKKKFPNVGGYLALWQAQLPLAQNIALDLARTACDRVLTRAEHALEPARCVRHC